MDLSTFHSLLPDVPMRCRSLLRVSATAAFVLAAGACASQPAPAPAASGPETPSVLAGTAGHVASYAGHRGCALIQAIAEQGDKQCPIVLPRGGTQLAVMPERPGSLLAIEHTGYDKDSRQSSLALTRGTYRTDGRGAPVLTRRVIATWTIQPAENLYFKAMAVSPDWRPVSPGRWPSGSTRSGRPTRRRCCSSASPHQAANGSC